MSDSAVCAGTKPRVMIFIDFWNYELTMKDLDPDFLTNWFKLPSTIINRVSLLIGESVQYERCFIHGSYNPGSEGDSKLCAWANYVLAKAPGVQVNFVPRLKKMSGPLCTGKDHHEIRFCPICKASMIGTQEKGVDTQIVIEMLDMAYSKRCDIMVLVSADKDFIPIIDKVQSHNIKFIHAFFPNHGHDLARKSWACFDLFAVREQFRRGNAPNPTC